MKIDGKRTDKLERLMIRIGFFSGLFILPAVGYLACLFYEHYNFDAWMLQWNQDICTIFSIPCPYPRYHDQESRPIFVVYMIKYVCSMLVGVTSNVWLYSGKTLISWRMFVDRIQGGGGAGGATGNLHVGANGIGGAGNIGIGGNNMTHALSANNKMSTTRGRGQAYV